METSDELREPLSITEVFWSFSFVAFDDTCAGSDASLVSFVRLLELLLLSKW